MPPVPMSAVMTPTCRSVTGGNSGVPSPFASPVVSAVIRRYLLGPEPEPEEGEGGVTEAVSGAASGESN